MLWIATDRDEDTYLYNKHPIRGNRAWEVQNNGDWTRVSPEFISSLPKEFIPTWEDEPIQLTPVKSSSYGTVKAIK